MVIAVNTRFLLKESLEGFGYFIQEVFRLLTVQHPQHQFYFIFDRPYDQEFIFSSNVHPLVLTPPARHPILWRYWYDVRIPLALRKIRADVFVSPDGYCSLATRVPQCMVVHDLGFLHQPDAYKKSHVAYLKKFTPRFIRKASSIATVSEFSKKDIADHYKTDASRISVVYSAAKSIFQPVSDKVREAVKGKHTSGNEYFIYVGALQPRKNLVHLLKAFSIFKKRQKSNMKMVLAGRLAWKNEAFLELLKTYKYREDVILTGYVDEEELVGLVGSAYALIYPSFFEGFGVPVLEAMKCGVPALTSENTSMQEIAGDAGLYFNPHDHVDMAEKLMLIYKDESQRSRLVSNGRIIAEKYSWQRTADLLWKCIESAADQK